MTYKNFFEAPLRKTQRQHIAGLMIVAIILVQLVAPVRASAADQCIPALDATGSLADEGKTAYKSIYDGNPETYLISSARGWQYLHSTWGVKSSCTSCAAI